MNLARQMLTLVGDLERAGDDPDGEFAEGALAILTYLVLSVLAAREHPR